jgi:hypothetical protein
MPPCLDKNHAAPRDRVLRDGRSAPQLLGLALGEASLTAHYLASERLAPVFSNDAARKPRALKGSLLDADRSPDPLPIDNPALPPLYRCSEKRRGVPSLPSPRLA